MKTWIGFFLLPCALMAQGQQAKVDTTTISVEAAHLRFPRPIVRFDSTALADLPVRGVNAWVGLAPGAVSHNGDLHLRGGRNDEIGFRLDGMNVTQPRIGELDANLIIPNAIESVTVYPSGMSPSQGPWLSGVVETRMKTGGDRLRLSGEIISDDVWAVKNDAGAYQVLGIDKLYSFGYNDYTLTLSGPVPKTNGSLRFFVAGRSWNQASAATRFQGFSQDSMEVIGRWWDLSSHWVSDTLVMALDVPPGRIPGYRDVGWNVNGNLIWDRDPIQLRYELAYGFTRERSSSADPLDWLPLLARPWVDESRTWAHSLHLSHQIDPTLSYTAMLSYYNRFDESFDSELGDDLMAYGDPERNPALQDHNPSTGYKHYWINNTLSFLNPGIPINTLYAKDEEERLSFRFNLAKQLGSAHEILLGAEVQQERIRRYSINTRLLNSRYDTCYDENGNLYPYFTEWDVYWGLNPLFIGYDWEGNEVNKNTLTTTRRGRQPDTPINLRNKPMTPLQAAVTLSDHITLKNMALNLGVRVDHIRNGMQSLNNFDYFNYYFFGYGNTDSFFDSEKQFTYVLPQVSASFPVEGGGLLHTRFSQSAQPASTDWLWGLARAKNWLTGLFSPPFVLLPNPNLKPERQTAYEIGFQTELGKNASLDVTAFYKTVRNLVAIRSIPEDPGFRAPAFLWNADFGSITGFTAALSWRGGARTRGQVFYTYSTARTTGSEPESHWDMAWMEEKPHFPVVPYATNFDVPHKLTALLTARTLAKDGPSVFGAHPLGNLVLGLTLNAQSGFPYTPIAISDAYSEVYSYITPTPLGSPNSARMPWLVNLDLKLSKTFCLGYLTFKSYLWILNVLDGQSYTEAFRQSGTPDSDGWLLTQAGQEHMAETGPDLVRWYNAVLTGCGSYGYQPPRQVRLGLQFEI